MDSYFEQTAGADEWDAALEVLYAAAEQPSLWATALGRLAAVLHADGAALIGVAPQHRITFFVEHEVSQTLSLAFFSAIRGVGSEHARTVFRRVVGNTDALNAGHHCAGTLLDCDLPEGLLFLTVRRPEQGAFPPEDLDRLRHILPHIRRAVAISLRIESLSRRIALGRSVSDSINAGVIAICIEGRIAMSNEAADRILDGEDGLLRKGRALHAQRPPDDAKLQTLITEARLGALAGKTVRSRTALIGRRSGAQPYAVSILPWRPPDYVFGADPKVLVIIRDVTAIAVPSDNDIRELLGLTVAEARLAQRLLEGDPLQKAAVHLGISPSTARTQLRSIFDKTATRRQVDLIRLMTVMLETTAA